MAFGLGLVLLSAGAQTNVPAETSATAPATNSAAVTNPAAEPPRNSHHSKEAADPNRTDLLTTLLAHNVIPLAGIFIGFAIPVVIIGLSAGVRIRKEKEVHQTLRAMIEKGMPMTPELIASLRPANEDEKRGAPDGKGGVITTGRRNDLRRGLILTGIGIGIVCLAGKAGWIVFFLGVAFLVLYLIDSRHSNEPTSTK